MTRDDVVQLVALAHRLGTTPRRLLATVARRVDDDRIDVGAAAGAQACIPVVTRTASDACADLLLTPVGSYSRVEVDEAIAVLWRDDTRAR